MKRSRPPDQTAAVLVSCSQRSKTLDAVSASVNAGLNARPTARQYVWYDASPPEPNSDVASIEAAGKPTPYCGLLRKSEITSAGSASTKIAVVPGTSV